MKNLLKTFAVAVGLAVFAVGCASGPKFSAYRSTVSPPAAGDGRIWFYRPSSFGTAVQPDVKLDSKTVGRAVPHGFFYADTQPGVHEVSASTEWTHKTSLTVTTNVDSYVRLEMMLGLVVGHVIPKEVPEAKATNEMNNLHLAAP
jgi:Protein of unknown function (DUF2846)